MRKSNLKKLLNKIDKVYDITPDTNIERLNKNIIDISVNKTSDDNIKKAVKDVINKKKIAERKAKIDPNMIYFSTHTSKQLNKKKEGAGISERQVELIKKTLKKKEDKPIKTSILIGKVDIKDKL